jgi:hypothetical protein
VRLADAGQQPQPQAEPNLPPNMPSPPRGFDCRSARRYRPARPRRIRPAVRAGGRPGPPAQARP